VKGVIFRGRNKRLIERRAGERRGYHRSVETDDGRKASKECESEALGHEHGCYGDACYEVHRKVSSPTVFG